MPMTWPFLSPMATASAAPAPGSTQTGVAANILSHQPVGAPPQSVPAPSHINPAAAAAASLFLAQRSAAQRRRYLS